MLSVKINPSTARGKRLKAELFENGQKIKTINFGSKNGFTFFDGANEQKRKSYIARHSKAGEDWNNPKTAGFWARWVLWERPSNVGKMLQKKGIKTIERKIPKNPAK